MKNVSIYFHAQMQQTMQVQIECANQALFDQLVTVPSVKEPLYLFTTKLLMISSQIQYSVLLFTLSILIGSVLG